MICKNQSRNALRQTAVCLCGLKYKGLYHFAGSAFVCRPVSHKCDFKSFPALFYFYYGHT